MTEDVSLYRADYITVLHGVLGFFSITYIIDGRFFLASILLVVCIGLDGLDGFIARRYNESHEFGAYLDLISDSISFGFAPALLLYSVYYDIGQGRAWESPVNALATFVPVVIVFFGVLRLSRFADKNRENNYYTGLPMPLLTLIIVTTNSLFGWAPDSPNKPFMVMLAVLASSLILYSRIKYPKIRGWGWTIGGGTFILLSIFAFIFLKFDPLIGKILLTVVLIGSISYIIAGPFLVGKVDKDG